MHTPAYTGAKAASLLMFRGNVETPHLESSRREIGPSQRLLSHNTQHSPLSQHTTFCYLTTHTVLLSQNTQHSAISQHTPFSYFTTHTILLSHNTQRSAISQHTTFSYLTTHNILERHISMPTAGFEPAIPANERSQTYATG